jgi:hypothetical protein
MPLYKLLVGKHSQKEPAVDADGKPVPLLDRDGNVVKDKEGNPVQAKVLKTYRQGQTFESKYDLVAMFNHPSAAKFEYIGEPGGRRARRAPPPQVAGSAPGVAPPVASVSPAGQVTGGFQETGGAYPPGQTAARSGAIGRASSMKKDDLVDAIRDYRESEE